MYPLRLGSRLCIFIGCGSADGGLFQREFFLMRVETTIICGYKSKCLKIIGDYAGLVN